MAIIDQLGQNPKPKSLDFGQMLITKMGFAPTTTHTVRPVVGLGIAGRCNLVGKLNNIKMILAM